MGFSYVPKWWNWQTRTFEGRVGQPMGVQIPPSAPIILRKVPIGDLFLKGGLAVLVNKVCALIYLQVVESQIGWWVRLRLMLFQIFANPITILIFFVPFIIYLNKLDLLLLFEIRIDHAKRSIAKRPTRHA